LTQTACRRHPLLPPRTPPIAAYTPGGWAGDIRERPGGRRNCQDWQPPNRDGHSAANVEDEDDSAGSGCAKISGRTSFASVPASCGVVVRFRCPYKGSICELLWI
jgi:hypothetical protein